MEINEKKLKTILKEQREEFQCFVDIKVKKQGDEFRAEVKEQGEESRRYLGALNESFESKIEVLAEAVEGNQEQLVAIREMVAKNTEDIEMIKMDLHIVKDDLKEKVSREEFKIVEKRIFLLEKKFQGALNFNRLGAK